MTDVDRRTACGIFILTFVAYAWFFGGGGWNQNAQLDLTRAVVERQTFHVDGYHVNTGDLSAGRGRHAYINKPPGVSFLAAIPYAVIDTIERAFGVIPDGWFWLTFNAWLITAAVCGVSGALIATTLYLYGRSRVGLSATAALAVALTVAFCTIVWPYATMLFAHVPSALFLLLAFIWMDERPLLAGAAAGIAGLTFYFCIPAAAVLAVAVAVRSWRAALRFVAGGVPFALLLAWYHTVCFGSPIRTSVAGSTPFVDSSLVLGVLRLPTADAVCNLTMTPYRGLFFGSPVLLFALIGVIAMRRRARREMVCIAVIVMLFFVATASFNGWNGGSAWGPRYLLSVIPLLGIPMMFAVRLAPFLWGVLAVVSFGMQFLATAVEPMPSAVIANPATELLLPCFIDGQYQGRKVGYVGINMQAVDERHTGLKHAFGSHEATWAAFNLGELLVGPGRRASVVPVLLWIFGGSALLARRARAATPPR